ncbi:C-type lectin domain family 4 member E isoform X1 [Labeo rohita]|uniref:C-type lectin domain family 4 member E isoform X1 n=1 Tax=Labeo rohita TaxID=84645 RepID=UPI0021E1CE81|nr:C-type lectin domain family 4 member E isoform X1 [Labeo rohita]
MEFTGEYYYENANCMHTRDCMDTIGPRTHCQNEGRARCHRKRQFWMPITVCLGIICFLLIAVIILQHHQACSKRGYLWGPDGLFMSNELKSWSDSRQYCRDRGADLVIINSEEKQRFMSSFTTERVWIGLSDTEQEGNMKWVDNSSLKQGFWLEGEPNDLNGTEDCNELNPANPVLNNWNDLPCSFTIQGICEK